MAGTQDTSRRRVSFFSRKSFAVFSAIYVVSCLLFLTGFKPAVAVILIGGFPGSAAGLAVYEFLLLHNANFEPTFGSRLGFCALGYFGSLWLIGFLVREIALRLGYKWSAKDEAAFGRDHVL
ncbi:MAG: hypothetical protein HY897_16130 [Deltaproteobacteria bacterium]|nr:hypothetical protein [Deltaproteobacteria bacterium]